MMDKINDFFTSITKRFANPLFSSFIIAWLVFNWRIVIVLIFYNLNTLKIEKCDSYIEYIETFSNWTLFYGPLTSALGYTFVFPFFRNGILGFNAWIKTWGTIWNLRITKSGSIPIKRYLIHRENYEKQAQVLSDVIKKEGEYSLKYEALMNESVVVKQKLIEAEANIQNLKGYSVNKDIIGDWQYFNMKDNVTLYITIADDTMFYMNEKGQKVLLYTIDGTLSSPNFNEFTLLLKSLGANTHQGINYSSCVQVLEFDKTRAVMRGLENNSYTVTYWRGHNLSNEQIKEYTKISDVLAIK